MSLYFSWVGDFNPYLSFGKAGKYIKRELSHLVNVASDPDGIDVQMFLGTPLWSQRKTWMRRCRRFIWFSMTEDPLVRRSHIARINDREGLVSPCPWCDDVYKRSGVTVPRFVVPLGIDPECYPFLDRPRRSSFTFLWLGVNTGHINKLLTGEAKAIGDRKRGWLVRQAFKELNLPNSRLILKQLPWPNPKIDISYHLGRGLVRELACWLTESEYLDIMRESDVMVWPTWAEGFGMPPLEAGATGMPVIVPNHTGIAEYFDPSWCLDLPYTLGKIWRGRKVTGALIDIEDIKRQMLWAYENRGRVREMGKAGSEMIHKKWTWEKAARPPLKRVLEYYGEAA